MGDCSSLDSPKWWSYVRWKTCPLQRKEKRKKEEEGRRKRKEKRKKRRRRGIKMLVMDEVGCFIHTNVSGASGEQLKVMFIQ